MTQTTNRGYRDIDEPLRLQEGFEADVHQWLAGKVFKDVDFLRRAIAYRDGEQCSVCKNATHNGLPMPLGVFHTDENPKNYAPDNLKLICPNCHSFTDTYVQGRTTYK